MIVAKCKTKSGSILGGALLRPLVWWWCAANFSADWLLNLAQVFGLPFRWATYEPTAAQETVDRICAMLQNMGSAGWAAFPAGTALELKAEGTKSGAQTPQGDMLDRADKQCDLLVLGQTLTTDTGGMGAGGGSHALGQVHADVRAGIIDAAAKFAAGVIEQQLIPAILRLNYGDADEAPTLTFHERGDDDLGARAQWIAALTNAGAGRIIPLDWLAKTFGIPKPDAGEMTLGQARQEEQANPVAASLRRGAAQDNEPTQQSGNGTLAARDLRHPATEDDALQAATWLEHLHPRAKGGLFTTKPKTAIAPKTSVLQQAEPAKKLPPKANANPEMPANIGLDTLGSGAKKAPSVGEKPVPLSPVLFAPEKSSPGEQKPGGGRSHRTDSSLTQNELLNGERIITEMQPHIQKLPELDSLRNRVTSIIAEFQALKPGDLNYFQRLSRLEVEHDQVCKRGLGLADRIVYGSRKLVKIPHAYRGEFPVAGQVNAEIRKLAKAGCNIVEDYVHPNLFYEVQFAKLRFDARAFFLGGVVAMNRSHKATSVAHEIIHGIELVHPPVLKRSRAFLIKRAAGRAPVPLCKIYPERNYEPDELTYDDEFIS